MLFGYGSQIGAILFDVGPPADDAFRWEMVSNLFDGFHGSTDFAQTLPAGAKPLSGRREGSVHAPLGHRRRAGRATTPPREFRLAKSSWKGFSASGLRRTQQVP